MGRTKIRFKKGGFKIGVICDTDRALEVMSMYFGLGYESYEIY